MAETRKDTLTISPYEDVWPKLLEYLNTYSEITTRPLCTKGDIYTYHIKFSSHTDMMKIRNRLIQWQPKEFSHVV